MPLPPLLPPNVGKVSQQIHSPYIPSLSLQLRYPRRSYRHNFQINRYGSVLSHFNRFTHVMQAISSPLLTSATLSQLNGTSQQNTQTAPSAAPPLPEQAQYTQTLAAPLHLTDVPSPSPSAAQAMQFPPGVKIPQGPDQASTSQVPTQQQLPVASARPPSTNQTQPPPRSSTASAFPGSLSDLVTSFEGVKQKGEFVVGWIVEFE